MEDITFNPAKELSKMISNRSISARELVEHYLQRIDRYNPSINAVVARNDKASLERAEKDDKALAHNETWGPLSGVPITIKDSFEVIGMPTTSGAVSLKNHFAKHKADAVQRLVDAGAIICELGSDRGEKLNLQRIPYAANFTSVSGTPWL